jgi:hypothetical protein
MVRRRITTNNAYIGMGPRIVRKGGQICVLLGYSIPLLLRKGEENSSYHVIGECYLDGIYEW